MKWYVTAKAVVDYRRLVAAELDAVQAHAELEALGQRAHRVKAYPDGRELWRGRSPGRRRLGFVVTPPRRAELLPALVAVLCVFQLATEAIR